MEAEGCLAKSFRCMRLASAPRNRLHAEEASELAASNLFLAAPAPHSLPFLPKLDGLVAQANSILAHVATHLVGLSSASLRGRLPLMRNMFKRRSVPRGHSLLANGFGPDKQLAQLKLRQCIVVAVPRQLEQLHCDPVL